MTDFVHSRTFLFVWGVPLTVVTAWFGGWWFTAVIGIVSAVAAGETMHMLLAGRPRWSETILVAGLCGLIPLAVVWQGLIALVWLYIAGVLAAGSLGLIRTPEEGARALLASTFTLLYIGVPFTSVLLLRHDPVWTTRFTGAAIVFYLWGGVWVTDTFAYLSGRRFGRHKLAPKLSPGKTIEGSLAGIAMTFVWTLLAGYLLADILTWWDRVFLGAIIGVLAVIGDLVESMLKRVVNVKDSSGIFMGHGGVLDRFDSLLFVQPAVYLYLVAAGILSAPSSTLFR